MSKSGTRSKATLLITSSIVLAAFAGTPFGATRQESTVDERVGRAHTSEIARLTSKLQSSDEEERYAAVVALASLETRSATVPLTSALKDSSERVRAAALAGLALTGDQGMIPVIAAHLSRDKKPFVRKAAAYALGRLRSAAGTRALAAAISDKDKEVRGAAAVALAQYSDPSAVPGLISALSDGSEFVRAQAARALGNNGRAASAASQALIGLLTSDPDNEVRRQVATALGRIGDRSALSALERVRRDPDPYLSAAAIAAIKMIQGPSKP